MKQELESGQTVPLDTVRRTFPALRYYDHPPPILLLVANLWHDYFPSLIEVDKTPKKGRTWEITASVATATSEIQKAHGSGALRAISDQLRFRSGRVFEKRSSGLQANLSLRQFQQTMISSRFIGRAFEVMLGSISLRFSVNHRLEIQGNWIF